MSREAKVEDTELVRASCKRGHKWLVDPGKKDGVQRCWWIMGDDPGIKCNAPIFKDEP